MNLPELIPDHETVDDRLKSLLSSAWQHVFKHEIASAMLLAQQAEKLAPDSHEVSHLLGLLASRDGRSDIALPLLQKALNGGVTERRLRDMAEALLISNQPLAALAPLNDVIRIFGESSETLGLLSAVQVALDDFQNAKINAARAIQLKPNLMAWDSNLAFCELIQGNAFNGLKALSGRSENLAAESRVPTLQFAAPCDLWLKNEQGPGDTIFNLRYAQPLVERGFKLHIQTDNKTKTLLGETGVFVSVKEEFNCPDNQSWFNVGDLPLAAMQLIGEKILPPLTLVPDAYRIKEIQKILSEFGPAPYIAVTWRAGPRGKKQRNGLRMFNKNLPLELLGSTLSGFNGTVVSIQRIPEMDENLAFQQALGRKFLNLSSLNDNLQDMLALLSIVDCYIAVPNTNVHLREALGKPSEVFVNRPFQDWRWQAEGEISPWYPNSYIYRQEKNGEWKTCFHLLNHRLLQSYEADVNLKPTSPSVANDSDKLLNNELKAGWEACDTNNIPEAIKIAQSVLKIKSEFAPALNLLGWAAFRDNKIDIALVLLQQAINLEPNNGKIVGDFIRVLTANKQLKTALKLAEQALDNPSLTGKIAIFYARAATYLQLNQIDSAIADYDACAKISPNNLDAACYNGMARLKKGDASNGFRLYSARPEARLETRRDGHVCPWLRGSVAGLKVLIKRDMGLGDELTFLRYLPWLVQAGVQVDYWCGHKLLPVLERTGMFNQVISDQMPPPNADNYDLTFWVHETPVAVEALGAPEVAPPLTLDTRAELVEKWRVWLKQCGDGPYIGINWRAGAAATGTEKAFSKLAKAVDAESFAKTLAGVNATFISLQRNVMLQDVTLFESHLKAKLHDAASLTDDIEDLLALLSLLDENIGVSNTNMHLRAGLGMGSRVLVQNPGGDWRWGYEGDNSIWFTNSKVYRQDLDQTWKASLSNLREELINLYGLRFKDSLSENQPKTVETRLTKKIIWITAGKIERNGDLVTSNIASARYRVIIPSQKLELLGWQSHILNEGLSKAMGGWCGMVPNPGDVVVVSKVFTEHTISLIDDAKARGAYVIVDHCDNFFWIKERGAFQRELCELADLNTVSTRMLAEIIQSETNCKCNVISDPIESEKSSPSYTIDQPLRVMWFGHKNNYRSLISVFDELAENTIDIELTVVSNLVDETQNHWEQVNLPKLTKRYVSWSSEVMAKEFSRCNIVILPAKEDEYGSVKSANRITEAIQAGKFVVAHPLPSYVPFLEHAYVGKSILQGIQWAIEHPQEALQRIKSGQQFVQKNYSSSVIAESWQQAFFEVKKAKNSVRNIVEEELLLHSKDDTLGRLFDFFQSSEAARVLNVTTMNKDKLKQQYAEKFPPESSINLKKIAVYTAIFGGYDTAPVLNHIDLSLDYILYTDNPSFQAPAPWQVRVVPAVFEDPQVDARRIKVLSHLFLPEYDATVWIDGNFSLKDLDRSFIKDVLNRAPVALCKHQFRECLYEEALEILRRGIDASTPVVKQIQYYQARQFPAKFGLHATGFLVRNHLDTTTTKMNMRWWEILSANSKRDQLSFDYVRWEQSISILPLPFNQRDNSLFMFKSGVGKHEVTSRRNDEHDGRSMSYELMNALSKRLSYDALSDSWPKQFLLALKELNQYIANQNGVITQAGSLFYLNHQPFVDALPDPRKGQEIRTFISHIANSKRVLHLGFDSGHTILLTLFFSVAKNVIALKFVPDELLVFANWFGQKYPKHVSAHSGLDIDSELLSEFDVVAIYQSDNFNIGLIKQLLANLRPTTLVLMVGWVNGYEHQIDLSFFSNVKFFPAQEKI